MVLGLMVGVLEMVGVKVVVNTFFSFFFIMVKFFVFVI